MEFPEFPLKPLEFPPIPAPEQVAESNRKAKEAAAAKMQALYMTNPYVHRALQFVRSGQCSTEEALTMCVVSLAEHNESLQQKLNDYLKYHPVAMMIPLDPPLPHRPWWMSSKEYTLKLITHFRRGS